MKFLRIILLSPFSLIYGLVTFLRNFLYDYKIFSSFQIPIPSIGLGNLSTGGTGKTPFSEEIISILLTNGYKPALISRGYGRSTSGFLLVETFSLASQIGDEPLQIKNNFPSIQVAVSEDRTNGFKQLYQLFPEINVIIFDDCFQHRKINPGLKILLNSDKNAFYNDFILPSGNLREFRFGKKRADIIIQTKIESELFDEMYFSKIEKQISPEKNQALLYSKLEYDKNLWNGEISVPVLQLKHQNFFGFSAIGDNVVFNNYLNATFPNLKNYLPFHDHHEFTKKELDFFLMYAKQFDINNFITTEKDYFRLKNNPFLEKLKLEGITVWIQKFSLIIHSNGKESNFKDLILNYVSKH